MFTQNYLLDLGFDYYEYPHMAGEYELYIDRTTKLFYKSSKNIFTIEYDEDTYVENIKLENRIELEILITILKRRNQKIL